MIATALLGGLFLILCSGFKLILSPTSKTAFIERLLGFSILTHGIHLLLLLSGMTPPNQASLGTAAFVQAGKFEWIMDPIPQALILTSIVINFAFTAFLLAYWMKAAKEDKLMLGFFFLLPVVAGLGFLLNIGARARLLLSTLLFGTLSYLFIAGLSGKENILLIGGWPHYAGVEWSLDGLNWAFIAGTLLLYWPTAIFIRRNTDDRHLAYFHFALAAALGSFLTQDLFNLYVMFELLIISSSLLFIGRKYSDSISVYFGMNMIGSAVFLIAIGFLYFKVETFNLAEISLRLDRLSSLELEVLGVLFSFAFFLKSAVFPFSVWMTKAYPQLNPRLLPFVVNVFSKVGILSVFKIFFYFQLLEIPSLKLLCLLLGAFTLIYGLLFLLGDKSLSMNLIGLSIAHSGLLILLACFSKFSDALSLYVLVDLVVLGGLFFVVVQLEDALDADQNIWREKKLLCLFFLILGLEMAGLPPGLGFFAEWKFLKVLLSEKDLGLWLTLLLILLSFSTLIWLARVWTTLFIPKETDRSDPQSKMNYFLSIFNRPSFGAFLMLTLSFAITALLWYDPSFFDSNINRTSLIESLHERSMKTPRLLVPAEATPLLKEPPQP